MRLAHSNRKCPGGYCMQSCALADAAAVHNAIAAIAVLTSIFQPCSIACFVNRATRRTSNCRLQASASSNFAGFQPLPPAARKSVPPSERSQNIFSNLSTASKLDLPGRFESRKTQEAIDIIGRGSWIRTNDLQYPKLPRYQAALYPDELGNHVDTRLDPAQQGAGRAVSGR
jgi:hypothetical protein